MVYVLPCAFYHVIVQSMSCVHLPCASRPGGKTNHAYEEDSEEDEADVGVARGDVAAAVLPWKRENGDSNKPMKQSEFPSWINNKEYTSNYSPYNTVNQGRQLTKRFCQNTSA